MKILYGDRVKSFTFFVNISELLCPLDYYLMEFLFYFFFRSHLLLSLIIVVRYDRKVFYVSNIKGSYLLFRSENLSFDFIINSERDNIRPHQDFKRSDYVNPFMKSRETTPFLLGFVFFVQKYRGFNTSDVTTP